MEEKQFVGREKEIQDFFDNYMIVNSEKNQVLQYYGVPGIGKTSLACELYDNLIKNDCLSIMYSLKQEPRPSKINILIILAKKLTEIEKGSLFSFPLFYTALITYYMKLSGNNVDYLNKKYDSVLTKIPVASSVLNALGGLVENCFAATSISMILDQVLAAGQNLKSKIDAKKYKQEISEIYAYNVEQIEDKIEYFFIKDMSYNYQNYQERRLYIFLDTYEVVKNTELESTDYYGDDWLRNSNNSLINSIPNSTWIFVARNKLEWNETYRNNYELADAIELRPLDEVTVQEYLVGKGIVEKDFIDGLYKLTKGSPLFMELCAKRYQEIVEGGGNPSINALGNDLSIVTIRFLKNMDPISLDVAYLLASLVKWTDEEVYEIANRMNNILAFSVPSYNQIVTQSFIVTDIDKKRFMQDIVQKTIYDYLKKLTGLICIRNIRKATFEYIAQNIELSELDFFEQFLFNIDLCHEEGISIFKLLDASIVELIESRIVEYLKTWRRYSLHQLELSRSLFYKTFNDSKNIQYRTIVLSRYLYELRHNGKNSDALKLINKHIQDDFLNKDRILIEQVHALLLDEDKHDEARTIINKIELENMDDFSGIILYYYAKRSLSENFLEAFKYINKLISLYKENQREGNDEQILKLEVEKLTLNTAFIGFEAAKEQYRLLIKEAQEKYGKNNYATLYVESAYYFNFYLQNEFPKKAQKGNRKGVMLDAMKIHNRLREIEKADMCLKYTSEIYYMQYVLAVIYKNLRNEYATIELIKKNYEIIEKNDFLKSEKRRMDQLREAAETSFGVNIGLEVK